MIPASIQEPPPYTLTYPTGGRGMPGQVRFGDTADQMRLANAAETGSSIDEATGALANAVNLPGVWLGAATGASYLIAYLVSQG